MARKKKETHSKADERRDRIFDVIVRSYIENAEPVGSRTISRHSSLGLSPASIRNVMADLEEEGFLKQPHTSAGRVPTDKGYRYWVDRLMEREALKPKECEWIRQELSKAKNVSGLKDKVSKIVTELTENAALVYFKNLKKVSFLSQILEELVKNERLEDFFEDEAELFIERYFRNFRGITQFIEETKEFARTHGYTKTAFGRKRFFPDINNSDFRIQREAERMAVNHPIQGTEADINKKAMIAIDAFIKEKKFEDAVRPLLQIHDELLFEIRTDVIPKVKLKIQKMMEGVWSGKVNMNVETKQGENWGALE